MKILVNIILNILGNAVAIMVLKQLGHYEFVSYITGLIVCGIIVILNLIINK